MRPDLADVIRQAQARAQLETASVGLVFLLAVLVAVLLLNAAIFGRLAYRFAQTKGLDRWEWFCGGTLLGPLAIVLLYLLPDGGPVCARCGECLRPGASYCRFCNRDLAAPKL